MTSKHELFDEHEPFDETAKIFYSSFFKKRGFEVETEREASVGWVERQRNPPLSLTIQNDGVRSSIHPTFATIICNRFCAIKLSLAMGIST